MGAGVKPEQLSDADFWEQEYARTKDEAKATAAVEARKRRTPSVGDVDLRAPADATRAVAGTSRGAGDASRAALSGAGQGATLGFADEILGGIDALDKAGSANLATSEGRSRVAGAYRAGRDKVRATDKALGDEQGGAHVAGELAGGIASGGLLERALLAAGLKSAAPAAGLVQRAAAGAKTGSAIGATAGLGAGEGDVADQAASTLKGASAGAVLGGILPIAGATVRATGKGVKAAANATGLTDVADAVKSGAARAVGRPVADPTRSRAHDLASQALERSGKTTADVRAMASGGKPIALVDAGENTRGLARVARAAPGKAKQTVADALEGRQDDQLARVAGDVEGKLGARKDVFQTADDLAAAREQEAAPLYAKAYAHGAVDDPRVQQLMQLPYFQKAWAQAKRLAELDEKKLPEIMQMKEVPIMDPANPDVQLTRWDAAQGKTVPVTHTVKVPGEGPTVETLHYLKLGLDDVLADAKRAPLDRGGITSTMEAKLLKKQQELLDLLDRHTNGDYTTARQAYAGRSKVMEALDDAKSFMTEDPTQLKRKITGMSAAEREMYRTGAVHEIRRAMDQTGDGRNVLPKIFGNTERRARLKSLFDDPAEFDALEQQLTHEQTMTDSRNKVLGGSQTSTNEAEKDAIDPQMASAAISAATGHPVRALGQAARTLMRRGQGVNEDVAGHLGDILTAGAKNPADLNAILDQLDERQLRRLHKATRSRLARGSAAVARGAVRGTSTTAALAAGSPSP